MAVIVMDDLNASSKEGTSGPHLLGRKVDQGHPQGDSKRALDRFMSNVCPGHALAHGIFTTRAVQELT